MIFCLREVVKAFMNTKENGEIYTWCYTLDWGIAELSLPYEKRNKGYKERDRKKNAYGAVFNGIFMNNKGPSHTFWKAVHCSSLLSLKRSLYK